VTLVATSKMVGERAAQVGRRARLASKPPCGRAMGMDIVISEKLLRQARESMDRRDVVGALRIGKQAQDRLKRDVPAFVHEEMRKARSQLLDLKLKGNDLAKPIGILKEASTFVKQEAWAKALRQVREFYREIESVG